MVKTCEKCGASFDEYIAHACTAGQDGTCATCRHWTQNECHARAPRPAVVLDAGRKLPVEVVVVRADATAYWPPTMPEDSCGEWAPRGSVAMWDAPDRPGFWWWWSAQRTGWVLVEAREVHPGTVCLYLVGGGWGGYDLDQAKELLKGKWVRVERPEPLAAPSEALS